ncbi:amidohydrolase family protein [Paracoccus versutus]|uniref:Putative TIM-barrel fold metal-dependent hydrolase n=1 Tax=Paracoccus versutus TaxID=34007 RepID=A0A3D9XD06_PARVE|nr:amidohydrolase family protein [Paracoccus versutus]REF68440.1 putative TIM-barrel fold metal-dependent hydrolase [Paracoccus versutus]WGR56640.1 amidohydrolase [Paracoccus versutus]WGR61485.1 amidohydrolase [Paracoccus ferrooxidans]
MTQKIIDIHPHIISPDTAKYPFSPLGGIRSDWSAERPFTFEQYVEEMEAAGIAQAAMVHSSTTYGYDNSYAADSVCRDLARFVGVYSVDIAAPDAVAMIEKWRRRGMAGLRLFGAGSTVQTDGRWMIAPETYKVWEHMAEIDMTVAIQTTSIGLPAVEEILERFPEVSIILDHLGRPDLTDGAPYAKAAPLWKLARFGNLFLKITPRTFDLAEKAPATPASFFAKLVAEYGADRLAWGSNFPANNGSLKELVAQGHRCFAALSETDRAQIWAGTAERLYPQLLEATLDKAANA